MPEMIFGVCISVKPLEVKWSRNSLQTPASTLKIAWLMGVLRSITLLSEMDKVKKIDL